MNRFIKRGVPLAMQRDDWWLDGVTHRAAQRWRIQTCDTVRLVLLLCLIALGDVLVWQVVPGVSLALFAFVVILAALAVAWPRLAVKARISVACGLVLCLLPLVELVQPLSIMIALLGLSVVVAVLAGVRARDLLRAAVRLWWVAPAQPLRDGARTVRAAGAIKGRRLDLRAIVMGWALPALATGVFAVLLASANPVLDQMMSNLATWQPRAPDLVRGWFWLFVACAVWPALVSARMRERLQFRAPPRVTVRREGIINAHSVARSLVAFNALFAVQTGMDALYLYGDAALPDGISPAGYAHRGAYPLLATALLAGLFAVLARPYLNGRPVVRVLMMLWLAQTLALVFASVWRLDLYVDAYGLTRLRIAAYIWMGVVAVGLGLTAQQVWQDRPAAWMMLRSGALGLVTLYVCAFVNFDGVVARYNLTRDVPADSEMLCKLSEGVIPALEHYSGETVGRFCAQHHTQPRLFQPQDWREWGFRNWRVRRSLAAMHVTETTAP